MKKQHYLFLFLVLAGLSAAMHGRIFTTDLIGVHIWRQSQTALNIRHFIREDFNIFNPRNSSLQFESTISRFEFPIMQWSIAAVSRLTGESVMVMRLCLFIIGLGGVLGFYFLLREIFRDPLVAFMGAWAFNFSPLFFYYTMNPLPDLLALGAAIWSVYFQVRYFRIRQMRPLWWAAFFLTLATLAKLPFVIFGAGVAVMALQQRRIGPFLVVFPLALLPALAWYIWVIPSWGSNGVLTGIFENKLPWNTYQDILEYHLFDLWPFYILNLPNLFLLGAGVVWTIYFLKFRSWLFWVLSANLIIVLLYFVLEMNMINKVHDYYMMPLLIPLFIGVGAGIRYLWGLPVWIKWLAPALLLWLPFTTYQRAMPSWSIEKSWVNPDLFLLNRELRAAVPPEEPCIMLFDLSGYNYPYLLDKKGYILYKKLPKGWIGDLVGNKGVRYMYSDSRAVEENPEVQPYLDSLLFRGDSMRVFRLKLPE